MTKAPNSTTITTGYYSTDTLNTNFEDIEDAFENTLSLDGSTPNAMQADFDLNGNDLLNVGTISASEVTVDGSSIAENVTRAETAATGAETSATEAEASALRVDLGALDQAVTDTETARDTAEKWAEEVEDTEVESGKYSARHHAEKADASRSLTITARNEAKAERLLAQTAADNAQSSALTCATWSTLSGLTGSTDGEGAEVLDDDTGTHNAASATGYDGSSVDNAGRYSWSATWSRWVRIGDTGLSAKTDALDVDNQIGAPLKTTITNAVHNRFTTDSVAVAPHGLALVSQATDGGEGGETDNRFDQSWFNTSREPNVLWLKGEASAAAQLYPTGGYFVPVTDLEKIVTPDDTTPPSVSVKFSALISGRVNQDWADIYKGRMWVILRYSGRGGSQEIAYSGGSGGATQQAQEILFNEVTTGHSGSSGYGGGDVTTWDATVGAVTDVADRRIKTLEDVPLRATYNGLALTGMVLMYVGRASGAGDVEVQLADAAIVSGSTIDVDARYSNETDKLSVRAASIEVPEQVLTTLPPLTVPDVMETAPTVTVGGVGTSMSSPVNIPVDSDKVSLRGSEWDTSTAHGSYIEPARSGGRVAFDLYGNEFEFRARHDNYGQNGFGIRVDGEEVSLTKFWDGFTLGAHHWVHVDFGDSNETFYAVRADVDSGGTSYTLGDEITLSNGVVLGVVGESSGVITYVEVKDVGSTSTVPSNPVSIVSTSGSGSGATFDVTWSNEDANVKTRRIEITFEKDVYYGGLNIPTDGVVSAVPATSSKRLLIAGDSITDSSFPDYANGIWADQVARYLGVDDNYVRFGTNGRGWIRSGSDFTSDEAQVIAEAPDQIVIALGTNDYLTSVSTTDLKAAVAAHVSTLMSSLPNTAIVVVSGFHSTTAYTDAVVEGATQAGAEVVDLEALGLRISENEGWQTSDNIHPSQVGHDAIARHLGPILAQKLR